MLKVVAVFVAFRHVNKSHIGEMHSSSIFKGEAHLRHAMVFKESLLNFLIVYTSRGRY